MLKENERWGCVVFVLTLRFITGNRLQGKKRLGNHGLCSSHATFTKMTFMYVIRLKFSMLQRKRISKAYAFLIMVITVCLIISTIFRKGLIQDSNYWTKSVKNALLQF